MSAKLPKLPYKPVDFVPAVLPFTIAFRFSRWVAWVLVGKRRAERSALNKAR
jgi:hypothetical protein